jgi:hypothetical protein
VPQIGKVLEAYREREGESANGDDGRAVFVWTANNDYATVVRIGFKKRISALWLEAYALKQYVDLNLTAFEKILKKFDKNTGNKVSPACDSVQSTTDTGSSKSNTSRSQS